MRQLGIPTAVDRLVQQAMLQVLEPIPDPTFSASSYGFRPGKSANDALRQITRRNRGVSLPDVIGELNEFLTGWVAYFRHAACKSHLQRMDEWVRRKLRCLRLKQCKRAKPIADFLHRLGVPQWRAWIGALSGKGWWRLSSSPPAMEGMTLAWFASLGLANLVRRYEQLNR
jgi:RNA-directed DNA polymerase